jgi:hypothetical protein
LRELSAAAGIPKERAALSFLLALPPDLKRSQLNAPPEPETAPYGKNSALITIRIISDSFPVLELSLPGGGENSGRYGCSEKGLVLVAGKRREMEQAVSGSLLKLPLAGGIRDPRTGAPVALCRIKQTT